MKQLYLNVLFLSICFLVACGAGSDKKAAEDSLSLRDTIVAEVPLKDQSGNYVTADYEKRNKGYDWVGVNIEQIDKLTIQIRVRSRSDQKKPTCTLDAVAKKVMEGTYKAQLTGGVVLFEFANERLTIKPQREKDIPALQFYCSGGASLADVYVKTNAPLDTGKVVRSN